MYGKLTAAAACALALAVTGIVVAREKGADIYKADSLTYKEGERGSMIATVWGDADRGPNGSFTKFKPGFSFGKHYHSSTLRILVVKGAYLLGMPDGTEKRI